jgi:hypothetical protein
VYSPVALLKYRLSPKGRYNAAKCRRMKAGRQFTITFAYWQELVSRPCYYCGGPLNPQGLGLDRIDNAMGYVEQNVVPCCKNCNTMKNSFLTHNEMLVAMKAILEYRKPK